MLDDSKGITTPMNMTVLLSQGVAVSEWHFTALHEQHRAED